MIYNIQGQIALMSCIEIKLNPFNKSSAIEWIKKYGKIEAAFETESRLSLNPIISSIPSIISMQFDNPLVSIFIFFKIELTKSFGFIYVYTQN